MKKITIIIESSSDYFDAYAENCPGVYGAGETTEDTRKNVLEGLKLYIEQNKRKLCNNCGIVILFCFIDLYYDRMPLYLCR